MTDILANWFLLYILLYIPTKNIDSSKLRPHPTPMDHDLNKIESTLLLHKLKLFRPTLWKFDPTLWPHPTPKIMITTNVNPYYYWMLPHKFWLFKVIGFCEIKKKKAQQTSHKNCHDLDQSSFVQVQGHCLKMQNSCLVISCNGKLLEANIDWYRDCLCPENMSWPKALVIRTSSKSQEKMVQRSTVKHRMNDHL